MCEVEKKLNVSWQLVSQFVSWDFCRYMCDQSENQSSETDVLTFLRNMIVSRTEKRATEITKQEIVAKFIMEIKMIRSKSRMKCIVDLSETVKKICPELNTSIANLLHHLENLLNVLEWNEDSEKDELILARIDQTVNDFTTEACKLLPLPDLLQVVNSWIHSELQAKVRKARKKPVSNDDLYQRVVNCLREETIEPSEAKLIAEALYGDKILEKIINTDTEVEADSQQNSLIFSSQQNSLIFSSQQNSPFLKPCQKSPRSQSLQSSRSKQSSQPLQLFSQDDNQEKQLDSDALFSLHPIFPQSQQYIPGTQDSLEPSSQQSLALSEQFRVIEGIQKLGSLNPIETYLFKPSCPEPLIPSVKPQDKVNPPVHHSEDPSETHSDSSDFSPQLIVAKNKIIRRLSSPEPEFYTAPDEVLEDNVVNVESDASSDFCPEKINPSNKHRKRYIRQIDSDLDLSDEEVPVVVPRVSNSKEKSSKSWLNFFSDNHNGSDTSDCEQNDECRFLTPTMFKTGATQTQPNRPAPNAVIWSSDDETYNSSVVTDQPSSQHVDDPTYKIHIKTSNLIASQSPPETREKKKIVATKRIKKKQLQSPNPLKTAKQMTLRGFGFSSDTSSPKEVAKTKVPEKKRFRLFDNDLMPRVLKPNVSNESALFEKPTLKKKPKTVPNFEELGKKRRCWECKITFKTPRELKKHVFMEHTTDALNSTEEFM